MRRVLLALLLVLLVEAAAQRSYASSTHRHLTPRTIARRVAAAYGEKKPRILHVQRTESEATYAPMYVVRLSGRFHKGHKRAAYLYFSALVRRWFIWGIVAQDAHHHIVWLDNALPRPHKS